MSFINPPRWWSRSVWTVLLLAGFPVHAAMNLYIPQNVPVYLQASKDSPRLGTLRKGSRVRAASQSDHGFRKVIVHFPGQPKRIGYISDWDLTSARLRLDQAAGPIPLATHRHVYGLTIMSSQLSQGPRSFTLSDGTTYNISKTTSQTINPGLWIEWPSGHRWTYALSFGVRKVQLSGQAIQSGTSTSPQDLKINQTMWSSSLGGRYFLALDKGLYLGAAVEGAYASEVSLSLGADHTLKPDGGDNPFYLIVGASLGWQWHLAPNWIVEPRARYGAVVTQKPNLTDVEFGLSIGYSP